MLKLLGFCFIFVSLIGCKPVINIHAQPADFGNIHNASKIWNFKYKFVENADIADLTIIRVNSNFMDNKTNIGEFHSNPRLILLDNKFCKTASKNEIKNLLAHEIGHYFCIEHTNKPGALMNNKISLHYRNFTNYEIQSLRQNKYKFLFHFYLFRLIKKFNQLN
jgi:hypothetical protein